VPSSSALFFCLFFECRSEIFFGEEEEEETNDKVDK